MMKCSRTWNWPNSDALARGLTPAEARREALRSFGGVEQMKDIHREHRSALWIENLVKDARYALAALRREPLFAGVAVGVLALGIGANTAMFSLVDGVLLKPMPFPNPERVVRVWEAPTPTNTNSTTTRTFLELKQQSRSFEALSAESLSTATVPVNGEPTRLNGRYVSWDHFAVFGIQPLVGRTFRPEEDQPGAARVVILSHAVWQRHFGGDRGILGKDLLLDDEPHQVIGVLPPGAFDRHRARPLDEPAGFWRLNAFTEQEIAASMHWLNPVGRLKPGVTLEQAQQDVLAVRARIADLIPAWKNDWSLKVEPFDQLLVGDALRQSMYVALGAVLLVLLIACANLTNLLLARSAARKKEMAVRSALGATRGRIAAQLLVESLVLGSLGGVAGIGLAALLIEVAVPLVPAMPFTAEVTLNLRVLAFATATAVVVSVLVGLLPAMKESLGTAARALNEASRGSSTSTDRARRTIVAIEVAVSVVLICGALLLFKSLARLQQVDIGARIDRVITMAIDLPYERYPSGHHLAAFYPLLIERIQAIPGVVSASVSGDVPLEGTGGENLRMPGSDERLLVRFKRADAGYFAHHGHRRRRRPRLHAGGPHRCAVCDRDQRSAGTAPARSFQRHRPAGSVCRSPDARLWPRPPGHHDHRRHHSQRARAERFARASGRDRVRPHRAGAADAGESIRADAWRRSGRRCRPSAPPCASSIRASPSPTFAPWNRSGSGACLACESPSG